LRLQTIPTAQDHTTHSRPDFASTQIPSTWPLSHRCRSLPVTCTPHPAVARPIAAWLAPPQTQIPSLAVHFVRRSAAQHPGCHTNIARAVVDTPCKGPPLLFSSAIWHLLQRPSFSATTASYLMGTTALSEPQSNPVSQNPLLSSPGSLKTPQPPRFPPRTLSLRSYRLLLHLKIRLQVVRALQPLSALTQRLSPHPINLISIQPRPLTTTDPVLLQPGSQAPGLGGRMTGTLVL
jgi:hypothetical protein